MADSKKRPDRHKLKTVSFRLPQDLMENLRDLARKNRRTISAEARLALEQHLGNTGDGSVNTDSGPDTDQ